MFDADRPILNNEQDRLGRTTFAKYLARCILDHKSPESLVIGLYGGWGVGKTSVINLTLQELRFAASNMFDDEKPIILNFSAWSYSGQDQLIYSFFRRLSSELHQAEFLENRDKIIHLLELYVSFFTHKPVPKALRPKHNFLTRIFRRNLVTQETFGWEAGRDLTQVKAELNELLRHQKHKIIIIIDNIMRLENTEIKQIFQIVKSMGDYVNTVYMLSLDKPQIIHDINQMQGSGGAEYLEKIVQLPFEIPPISHQDIEAILVDRLKKIIEIIPEEAWDKDYWADLYYSTLKFFFENVRDITRYMNTLGFSFAYVKDVVNPVDFFAITALQVFAPNVYYGIRDNKDLFTDLMDDVYRLNEKNIAEDKTRCDEIINRTQKISPEMLVQLLLRLFPRLRRMYESNIAFYHSEAIARKNLRICSPDVFDVYFRLSMPTGVIPDAELQAILGMAGDPEGFALALLRLNKDDKIIRFLDLLDNAAVVKIPNEHIGNVIDALIDGGDLFAVGEDSPVGFNTPMRIHRIIHQLLSRFDANDKRFTLLQEAINKSTNSLYIIVHELTVQSQEHNEAEDTYLPLEHRDVTPSQLQMLQQLAVIKISSWAETGRLIEHPQLLPLLYAWKSWGDEFECRNYISQVIQDDKGLLAFLGAALKEPIDQVIAKLEKTDWHSYLANIEDFIPIKTIEPHAIIMFEDAAFEKLREREQLAILIFLDLINAKTTKNIPKTTI
ncbi:MAG: KAP family P-loop NTPase fold protein [Gammaproteobacteria bacterium]